MTELSSALVGGHQVVDSMFYRRGSKGGGATVKYTLVQNAQYKVKYQSVLPLLTHGGVSGWFGLGI